MEYMESKMQDYIEAGINERDRCYNEIAELEHLCDKYKELYEASMLSEATAKQYAEEVDKQNKELAAQVEALGDKLSEVVALLDVDGMTAVQWLLDNCPEIESLTNIEPEQHLAEIRAQAGRAGYITGAIEWTFSQTELAFQIERASELYADNIKEGE